MATSIVAGNTEMPENIMIFLLSENIINWSRFSID